MIRIMTIAVTALLAFRPSLSAIPENCGSVGNAADLTAALHEGRENVLFSLSATVIFPLRQNLRLFAVSDSTGTVILHRDAADRRKVLKNGDRIRVSGVTKRLDATAPCNAICTSIVHIAHGTAPEPESITASDLNDGRYDDRLVRISGTVRDAFRDEIDPQWGFLVLRDGKETVYACFPSPNPSAIQMQHLTGAVISIPGLCSTQVTEPRHLSGRCLLFAGLDDVSIIHPAPKNPFDVPSLNAKRHTSASTISDMERRRIAGRVIAVWRRNRLLLRTPEGQIARIDLAGETSPRYGDSIEAAGNPETDLYRLNLSRAIWRTCSTVQPPEATPQPMTADELLADANGRAAVQTRYHGQPITVRGIVRSMPSPNNPNDRLGLECDRRMIPVDASACQAAFKDVEIGCRIEVSGTFLVETENWRPNAPFPHIDGFALVVRTPDDVKILSRPPWWTPARLMTVIGALIAAIAGIFAWNRSLNRLAERRGRELTEETIARVTSDLKVGERTRLAIELHDSLSQNLTGASLEVETAAMLAPEGALQTLQHLNIAAKTLKSCREDLRNCLWDLRNDALGERTMDAAIRSTIAPHVGETDVTVRFNVSRELISDNTAHALLRIIRELVQNAVRHGGATSIGIAGCLENGKLHFSVRDNGCGFDANNVPGVRQGHFGIQGIRERMNQFGGEMRIDSRPGCTKIAISIRKQQ